MMLELVLMSDVAFVGGGDGVGFVGGDEISGLLEVFFGLLWMNCRRRQEELRVGVCC